MLSVSHKLLMLHCWLAGSCGGQAIVIWKLFGDGRGGQAGVCRAAGL